MDKQRIMPEGFWDWPLPTTFSQGWRVGNLVFVGGQVSQTPDGKPLHPFFVLAFGPGGRCRCRQVVSPRWR